MQLRSFIVLLILLVTLPGQAQVADKEKLDAFFDLLDEKDQGMGSVSVFIDGEEVYTRSIGMSDVKKDLAAGPHTRYRIGSISKTFTATLIMQLVDEGKLTLDTPLSEFYPDIPNAEKITIEHLLRHRSGLFNFTSAEDYRKWMESRESKEGLLEKFIENGTVFEPDGKFEYSNTNYVLLGFIAEDVTRNSYPELLEARITSKCGLTDTYYGQKIGTKEGEAFSYEADKPWKKTTETDMSIPLGAGGVVSSATDISKYFVCLFGGDLVSDESLEQMMTIVDGYGLGLFSFPFGERQAFGHNGGIDGFQSSAGYFPDDNVVVSYLSNGVNYPINSIMIGTLSYIFDVPFDLPAFIEVPEATLDAYAGTYSSDALPIDLKIYREGSKLMGQGTGQPPFPLSAVNDTTFKFDQAGITLIFSPEENKLELQQGGQNYEMTRE